MFEAAEVGRAVPKREYEWRALPLREALLEAQQRLREEAFPVVVVFAGVDGAGKGETVNLLNEWMDPRCIVTRAFGEPSDEERERPRVLALLARPAAAGARSASSSAPGTRDRSSTGSTGATTPAASTSASTASSPSSATLDRRRRAGPQVLDAPRSRRPSSERLEALERDPLTRWRVTETRLEALAALRPLRESAERAFARTSTAARALADRRRRRPALPRAHGRRRAAARRHQAPAAPRPRAAAAAPRPRAARAAPHARRARRAGRGASQSPRRPADVLSPST